MWGKSLLHLQDFAFDTAKDYFKDKQLVVNNFKRGYKYFCDSFLADMWTAKDLNTGQTRIKAKCYRSQRKNEPPHEMKIIINNGRIYEAYCTCAIGLTGSCGHLIGLCYTLEHFVLKGYDEIPEELACTELPQKWGKPRNTSKVIEPECLLNVAVYSPNNIIRKKDPITSTLRRNPCKKGSNLIKQSSINRGKGELIATHKKVGYSYLLPDHSNSVVPLPMGLEAQEYSILHCHLLFNRNEPVSPASDNDRQTYELMFKSFPIMSEDRDSFINLCLPQISLPNYLNISEAEAVDLEKRTRLQSKSTLWSKERSKRFTASNFGELFNRKKRPNEKFLKRIFGCENRKNGIPSVQHGKKYEAVARDLYKKERTHIGVYPCGLVIHPKISFLGASPDGHLVDPHEQEKNGVLEIKCPLWETLLDGVNGNNYLTLCEKSGTFKLNNRSAYYSQVQGQMLLCGVSWCDFTIFVQKSNEVHIERIYFDSEYCKSILEKLYDMYKTYAVPYVLDAMKENSDNCFFSNGQ